MISIKSAREIELMREAGEKNILCFKEIERHIKPGITTDKINKIVEDFLKKNDCISGTLGFEGYPKSVCVSVNDEVVHGIPGGRVLKDGDIVSVDLVLSYKGYHADATRTYIIGSVPENVKALVEDTKGAFYAGVSQVKEGARIRDISVAVEEYAHSHGLSVVEELVGHGIGTNMHEEPDVPNFDNHNMTRLKAGMTICIEPMLNLGTKHVYVADDDWTVKTADGAYAAHYENTVLVTKDGYEILTGE